MKFKRIPKPVVFLVLLAPVAVLIGLILNGKQFSTPPQAEVDYQQARVLSDAVADDLMKDNAKALFSRLDLGFHTIVRDEDDLEKVIKKMYGLYGKPLECSFKISKTGLRVDGPWKRPSRTFFYAVKTTRYPKGKYFLKVEVVQAFSGGFIDISGFGFFAFRDGMAPDYLQ
jgi:hypothetical protein